jgi:hypothetical protein
MSTPGPQKRSRIEMATFGSADVLDAFEDGKNPHFCHKNGNFTSADPRIPQQPVMTTTLRDQKAIDDAYAASATHTLDRMIKHPDTFAFEYKQVNSGMTCAVGTIREGGRNLLMQTPVGALIASNVRGDVTLELRDGTETKQLAPTDADTIVNKTNWELVLGARSIETEEKDGAERNRSNFKMMKFFESMRKVEHEALRRICMRMVETYDDDDEKCTFMPELMCTPDINRALAAKDLAALLDAMMAGPFTSCVKQAELKNDERMDLRMKYKAKHNCKPTEEYMTKNVTVLPNSDKMTFKTKCFQMQYNGDVKTDGYTPLARDICEQKKGMKWIKPVIHRCDGEGELRMQDHPINPGDSAAVQFNLSFIVYTINNKTVCSFKPQWNNQLLLYRKRKTGDGDGARPVAKKIKLGGSDDAFGDAVSAQLEGAMGAGPTLGGAEDLPSLDDYE